MVGWRARSERRRPWRSGGMCDARPRTKVDQLSPNLNSSLVDPLTNHRLCPNQEEPVGGRHYLPVQYCAHSGTRDCKELELLYLTINSQEGHQTTGEGCQTTVEGHQTTEEGRQTTEEGRQTTAGSPDHRRGSPDHSRGSPDHSRGSPDHRKGSPDHRRGSPDHSRVARPRKRVPGPQ